MVVCGLAEGAVGESHAVEPQGIHVYSSLSLPLGEDGEPLPTQRHPWRWKEGHDDVMKRRHPLLFNHFTFHNPINISLPSKGALFVAFIYLMFSARAQADAGSGMPNDRVQDTCALRISWRD